LLLLLLLLLLLSVCFCLLMTLLGALGFRILLLRFSASSCCFFVSASKAAAATANKDVDASVEMGLDVNDDVLDVAAATEAVAAERTAAETEAAMDVRVGKTSVVEDAVAVVDVDVG
jgi:hypothetical protein